ncbi:MAG: N-acetylneuraminate synthase family protein [Spirochaetaceae bacterium]|jgi:sialic acid synthase SpsE|nr:N-acetylneuraminate synthase family protein [Spirochaetaceae bacterium]
MTQFFFEHTGKGKTFIIAEIGTSHGGSLDKARALIDAAAASGADCAKFQWVYADEILHPDTGFVTLPGGQISLYERFRELEMPPSFYAELKAYTESRGLIFLCSPFGIRSLAELAALAPKAIKIASPELNHFPLLEAAAAVTGEDGVPVPLILSSGVSLLEDIEKALALTADVPNRALLHCITSYPAPEEEYNLRLLTSLSSVFGIPLGISDHSLDPVLVPILSVACGGVVVEKHITLDNSGDGLDDPVALTPAEFGRMVQAVRTAENQTPQEIIEQASIEYGRTRVEAVLGSGKKRLAPSEAANYRRTNRSLHFMRDLPAGAVIKEADVAVLRTEKILTPGISPEFLGQVKGAVLAKKAVNGEGVNWEHLVER